MKATTKRGKPRQRVSPGAGAQERILLHTKVDARGCWVWQGSKPEPAGYGRLSFEGKSRYAHRVAYEGFIGPIPLGLELDHLCRNRACCNPAHLEPVTSRVNNNRSPLTNGSKDACIRGHEFTPENTYPAPGRRVCATCRRAYFRLHRALTPDVRAQRRAAGVPLIDLDAYFAKHAA